MEQLEKHTDIMRDTNRMVVMNYKATVFNNACLNMRQADHFISYLMMARSDFLISHALYESNKEIPQSCE